jgi:HSP20 family protein
MTRNPFEELEDALERMAEQFEEGVAGARSGTTPVDVRDEGDAFVVAVDLPGYDADDVELTLSGRRLEVAAERTHEAIEEGDYVRRERTRTEVERSVRLPADVDEAGIAATLDAGVLTVTLPKRAPEEGRRIEIED